MVKCEVGTSKASFLYEQKNTQIIENKQALVAFD